MRIGQGLARTIAERFALEDAVLALGDINRIAVEETTNACRLGLARTIALEGEI
jgi:hypothetical protein